MMDSCEPVHRTLRMTAIVTFTINNPIAIGLIFDEGGTPPEDDEVSIESLPREPTSPFRLVVLIVATMNTPLYDLLSTVRACHPQSPDANLAAIIRPLKYARKPAGGEGALVEV